MAAVKFIIVLLLLVGNIYLLMEVPNHTFEKSSAATTQQLSFTPSMRANKNVMDALDIHRLVVVVITGIEYHDSRLKALLETWGRWLPRERLVVISDAFDHDLGTIEAPNTLGGYGPSQKKWHHAVLAVANQTRNGIPAEWVCVVDDDTFLFIPNLLRLISTLDPADRAWYGEICSQECHGPCVCGGAGWVAPMHLFFEIADEFESNGSWPPPCCTSFHSSDQIISTWMNDVAQVPLVMRPEFKSYPPDLYLEPKLARQVYPHLRLGPEGYRNVVSFHYVHTGKLGTSTAITPQLLYALARGTFSDTKENREYM
jgi:hypothetical protein